MENLWKELLAYVKKKTVVKKVLEYVEKDILLKNVLKCIPRLVVSFMVIGFIAEVCASGIEYFSRPVRQDLYEHIPDIHIYGTDTLLCDELTIIARTFCAMVKQPGTLCNPCIIIGYAKKRLGSPP